MSVTQNRLQFSLSSGRWWSKTECHDVEANVENIVTVKDTKLPD